jgi:hypothetical protein
MVAYGFLLQCGHDPLAREDHTPGSAAIKLGRWRKRDGFFK